MIRRPLPLGRRLCRRRFSLCRRPSTIPAYLLDNAWEALSWNAAAADLFKGWLDSTHDRNLMRFVFLSPAASNLIVDLDERARRLVAEFRADISRRLNEPSTQSLIDELMAKSPDFAKLWHAQAVTGREGGERRFKNPDRCYYQATLTPASHPDVKLVTLTPMTL